MTCLLFTMLVYVKISHHTTDEDSEQHGFDKNPLKSDGWKIQSSNRIEIHNLFISPMPLITECNYYYITLSHMKLDFSSFDVIYLD